MKKYICEKELENRVVVSETDREADVQAGEDVLNVVADVLEIGLDDRGGEQAERPLWVMLKEYQEKLEAKMKEQGEQICQCQAVREVELEEIEELKKENARLTEANVGLTEENCRLAKENTTYQQSMAELTVKMLNDEKERERIRAFINHLIGECATFVGNAVQAQVVHNYYPGSTNINQCDIPNACFGFVPPTEQNSYALPRQAQGDRN